MPCAMACARSSYYYNVFANDSLREGYVTNTISIVNAHQNHGRMTRLNQVGLLVIAVFSLESSHVGYSNFIGYFIKKRKINW